jgi:hypothetical protein
LSWCCKFVGLPRGSSAAGAGPSWVGGTREVPSGEIWGGNGPAAGALIGLRKERERRVKEERKEGGERSESKVKGERKELGTCILRKTDGPSALLPKRDSGGKPVQGHGPEWH